MQMRGAERHLDSRDDGKYIWCQRWPWLIKLIGLSGVILLAHICDFVEVLGRISALQNLDINHKALKSLRLIEHRVRVQNVLLAPSSTGAGDRVQRSALSSGPSKPELSP